MRLYYYKSRDGNVGDDLNAVLWQRVFGEDFFTADKDRIFLGIGSILDNRPALRDVRHTVVFGSGLRGKYKPPAQLDRFDIRFVRGPLSAHVLRRHKVSYITDPAAIVPLYFQPEVARKTTRLGYVPYFMSPDHVNQAIAQAIGAKIISPTLPVQSFINEIASCEKILSEAMHGAILADAYRIPWAGCRMISGLFEGSTTLFKWEDWMQSMSIKSRLPGPVPETIFHAPRKIRRIFDGYALERSVRTAQKIMQEDAWALSSLEKLTRAQARIQDEAELLMVSYPQG